MAVPKAVEELAWMTRNRKKCIYNTDKCYPMTCKHSERVELPKGGVYAYVCPAAGVNESQDHFGLSARAMGGMRRYLAGDFAWPNHGGSIILGQLKDWLRHKAAGGDTNDDYTPEQVKTYIETFKNGPIQSYPRYVEPLGGNFRELKQEYKGDTVYYDVKHQRYITGRGGIQRTEHPTDLIKAGIDVYDFVNESITESEDLYIVVHNKTNKPASAELPKDKAMAEYNKLGGTEKGYVIIKAKDLKVDEAENVTFHNGDIKTLKTKMEFLTQRYGKDAKLVDVIKKMKEDGLIESRFLSDYDVDAEIAQASKNNKYVMFNDTEGKVQVADDPKDAEYLVAWAKRKKQTYYLNDALKKLVRESMELNEAVNDIKPTELSVKDIRAIIDTQGKQHQVVPYNIKKDKDVNTSISQLLKVTVSTGTLVVLPLAAIAIGGAIDTVVSYSNKQIPTVKGALQNAASRGLGQLVTSGLIILFSPLLLPVINKINRNRILKQRDITFKTSTGERIHMSQVAGFVDSSGKEYLNVDSRALKLKESIIFEKQWYGEKAVALATVAGKDPELAKEIGRNIDKMPAMVFLLWLQQALTDSNMSKADIKAIYKDIATKFKDSL